MMWIQVAVLLACLRGVVGQSSMSCVSVEVDGVIVGCDGVLIQWCGVDDDDCAACK